MQATGPLKKPSKQRRRLYQAPDHVRHRLLAANLSLNLRASHGVRSFPVRTGDTVRVARGDHKGVEGKIARVDLQKYRIYVEGLTREKVDGTTIFVPIHPSKVTITRLNLDDKWRKEIIEVKKQLKKREVVEEKPKARPRKVEEKPIEAEKIKEAKVEERPQVKEKVAKKPTTAKKRAPKKEKMEKKEKKRPKTETKETEEEKKLEPKKRTRKTTKKTATEAKNGED